MKKQYMAPRMEVIEIQASAILAASDSLNLNDDTVNTSTEGVQKGRNDGGTSNPDLWNQMW